MSAPLTISVNGRPHHVRATPDTPLLYVLRNELSLNSAQFGCGLEQCGACRVLIGQRALPTCKMPVAEAAGLAITTVEGLAPVGELHPIQKAFLEEQAAQCGFCTNGIIITVAALLWDRPQPTEEQIRQALDGNLCRCGSHLRVIRAVKRAARLLEGEMADE